ncbi:LysR family transcriptional regulator [Streptomyces sp. WAC 06738]|uniref:LysR family transcriptional regulator n=1 Tax=Streptomyces sp. WAC 06738 TaxID=2203210 RepID=UPI000F6D2496|nr:LysR family transcriptional regulator [Streptomyces sp. WAC 06738]AZM49450.1 LysR family transcriptional regulator [Streptomyces sp. WAC 06738]
MDLDAVRTFVAAADTGQFQEAAAELMLTQQAVSKRIAGLEKGLGVRLFTRTARGAKLTIDGQAFLPHARTLLRAAERAAASVRPGSRALRVDVVGRRVATAGLLRDFHRAHPEVELDVVTVYGGGPAVEAVRDGTIDATFRTLPPPGRKLPDDIAVGYVMYEPVQLVTGPAHEFAGARSVRPAQLAGHRIWMPGNAPGTEWAAYYEDMAAEFGFVIDAVGPDFGVESLLDTIAGSATVGTFLSERTPLVWPVDYDLCRIPLLDPTPVYPHLLHWHTDNAHPGLTLLRDYAAARAPRHTPTDPAGTWAPAWSR